MANIYTVGQVNSYIKNMFESDFVLERIQVQGEVSNCKYNPSGHIYFTLKDANNTLSAVMFSRERAGLKFRLQDGQKIVVTGRVSIYEPQGKYQIYVSQAEMLGSGDLYEKFLALKKELQEMGMFDACYKQPIPAYVKRVGIVTAKTGAAIQDIINISTRRNPYVQLILYPAQVQGIGAAQTIVDGIQCLDQYGNVDVIIVGRGGGSIEDLWAFNEEIVARAIFECKTPIISAVGHETDFTIADFVSDLRAPTPSAAAELAVYEYDALMRKFEEGIRRLDAAMDAHLKQERQRIQNYRQTLRIHSPEHTLFENRQRLDERSERMDHLMETKLLSARNLLSVDATKLDALSPLKKFSSGYSYTVMDTTKGRRPVLSVTEVKQGDVLNIYVVDGLIETKVEKATLKHSVEGSKE